jgi:hypothetical protein
MKRITGNEAAVDVSRFMHVKSLCSSGKQFKKQRKVVFMQT